MFRGVPETAGHKMRQRRAIEETLERQRRQHAIWAAGEKRIVLEHERNNIN